MITQVLEANSEKDMYLTLFIGFSIIGAFSALGYLSSEFAMNLQANIFLFGDWGAF